MSLSSTKVSMSGKEVSGSIMDLLCCPRCEGNIGPSEERTGDAVVCAACRQTYPITDGIPQLFWPHDRDSLKGDVTEVMKQFYEKTPFPNYDDFDTAGSLIEKA